MTARQPGAPTRSSSDTAPVVQAVTVIMGTVVGLTFLFGFGNVLNLALRLGVPVWVAPLVAPAVDLSILGLLLGTRHLALHGATPEQLRPARRLLIFASLATLALNIADPLVTGAYGKAAFDAVGPFLLIGWAEVGPGLLQSISATVSQVRESDAGEEVLAQKPSPEHNEGADRLDTGVSAQVTRRTARTPGEARSGSIPSDLLERARHEDAAHRAAHQRPISADSLRTRLGIGAKRARRLVALVRAEAQAHAELAKDKVESDDNGSAVTLAA